MRLRLLTNTRARKAFPWVLTLPVAAMLSFVPAALEAGQLAPEDRSHTDEQVAENSCRDWQRARPCLGPNGEVRYQCVARGPFAKFWSMVRGDDRPEDDEVRVKVIREAPSMGGSPSLMSSGPTSMGSSLAQTSADEGRSRQSTRIVKKSDRPACRDNGRP